MLPGEPARARAKKIQVTKDSTDISYLAVVNIRGEKMEAAISQNSRFLQWMALLLVLLLGAFALSTSRVSEETTLYCGEVCGAESACILVCTNTIGHTPGHYHPLSMGGHSW